MSIGPATLTFNPDKTIVVSVADRDPGQKLQGHEFQAMAIHLRIYQDPEWLSDTLTWAQNYLHARAGIAPKLKGDEEEIQDLQLMILARFNKLNNQRDPSEPMSDRLEQVFIATLKAAGLDTDLIPC